MKLGNGRKIYRRNNGTVDKGKLEKSISIKYKRRIVEYWE